MLPKVVMAMTAAVANTAQLATPATTNLVRTVSGRTALAPVVEGRRELSTYHKQNLGISRRGIAFPIDRQCGRKRGQDQFLCLFKIEFVSVASAGRAALA
jgi:hypothetical protein